ncbi:nucleotidyl transferase AbiEii/AbiGii toxin family protein [Anabaena sphaerica FACHB-251]|uniref:Nucleotidyl transferase AbiEii/AbiGii toxin family protein n=1 Tax=Anabaena sphaerica FACHB-251 TaxID=2692883 RepID=A0A927A098_9NOST|nr:nucleotidyl transferase AbiEii/AbiGii toxin family protein [Anabaena sphaerica]MBD2293123.1 nucleotidyl transferase AbiEii/AbiGii toxin family protein [Anabaena sphaerica FACHB-251]
MKSKKPVNIAASIQAKLLNLSKTRGEDYNYLLTRYFGERLLYRLSQSPYQAQYILKGATLFKVWNGEPHRATKDLDLLCFGNNEIEYLVNVYKEICTIHCEEDGITFLPESVRGELIKEAQEYEGVRIKLKGQLVKIEIAIQVDIGFGDAVTPDAEEVEIEPILNTPKPRLRIYPRETVIAEKFQAMVSLGISNSRIKDFYDIWFLCKNFEFQGNLLSQAINNTFHRRKTEIPVKEPLALSEEFVNDSNKQQQWQAFKKKLKIEQTPNSFGELINEIQKFIMPPSVASAQNENFDKIWSISGYWQDANNH